ncbi:response regulator [Flavobacterium hauense]
MSTNIKSILLVDDDSDDQLLFREALAEVDSSVQCHTARNGIEAIETLNLGILPDIIVMDVNMPMMNGLECLRELKATSKLKDIPVIMGSTSCSESSQKECFDNGAVGYIEKPSDYFLLCAHVKSILTSGLPATLKTPAIL